MTNGISAVKADLKMSKKTEIISPKLPMKFLQKRQHYLRKKASPISPKRPMQNHQG